MVIFFLNPILFDIIHICLEVSLYVHKRGQLLLSDLRNELTEIENIEHIVEIELGVDVNKLISTPTTECAEDGETFDSCIETTMCQAQDQCHIHFLNKPSNESFCTNYTGILEDMKIFQSSFESCLPPCTQVKVNMQLNPVNWLNVMTNSKISNNLFTPGYFLKIPSSVMYSEMNESYTWISFIAEFGGWVGLFLGLSILGGFEFVESQIFSSNAIRFKKAVSKSGLILKMACSLGVLIIVTHCGLKLITNEKSMDVKIEENLNDISISLCSVENIYQVSLNNTNYYMGNSTSFWNTITQLSNKLEMMELVLEDGNSVIIYDSSWDHGSEYILYSINTPQFDTFIETCHTLDLKLWNRIRRMEVMAKKELTIYVHITGQLLRSGRQGFSFMNKDTTTLYG